MSNVPHRQTKPVFIWSQMEVCKWLKRQIPSAQAAYADMFAKHDITGNVVADIIEILRAYDILPCVLTHSQFIVICVICSYR